MFNKEILLIIEEINKLLISDEPVIISIDGKSASGKTFLAESINKNFDSNVFHMDDFFLTPELRTPERLNEIGGNVDYIRFDKEIIQNIVTQKDFNYNIYNCMTNSSNNSSLIKAKKLNIIEGAYSMHPSLINNYNFKIFVDIDNEEQIKRILKRNGVKMLQRFIDEWIPKENQYFDKMNIKEKCDLVINDTLGS